MKLEIELKDGGWWVTHKDRYADHLSYDEMLGLVAALTMPEKRPTLNWLKTEAEHKAWEDRLNKKSEEL